MIGRVIEVLENGRVHVSVGREQWRDIIVMYPANMRLEIAQGQRIWVMEPNGSSTERYGMPVALHNDNFASGPGDLVAFRSQMDHVNQQLKNHVHASATPGSPTGPAVQAPLPPGEPIADPPPGAQKVRAE